MANLFSPGQIVATPGAMDACCPLNMMGALLQRHLSGDFGDLDDEDRQANEYAIEHGERILSSYQLSTGVKVWIITEADRSATTVLLPEEY